jgi:hypothetical protein
VSSAGGTPVRVLDNARYPLEFGEHLYFERQGAIWRIPLEGGPETEILSIPDVKKRCGWDVTEKGIYYVDWNVNPPEFWFFDWNTEQQRLVEAAVGFPQGVRMSADSDSRHGWHFDLIFQWE